MCALRRERTPGAERCRSERPDETERWRAFARQNALLLGKHLRPQRDLVLCPRSRNRSDCSFWGSASPSARLRRARTSLSSGASRPRKLAPPVPPPHPLRGWLVLLSLCGSFVVPRRMHHNLWDAALAALANGAPRAAHRHELRSSTLRATNSRHRVAEQSSESNPPYGA
jgi:hypothetical protein